MHSHADDSSVAFKSIFESLPGNYLILAPDPPLFTIVAVSDAYASATLTIREQILGRGIFEVFPDNPDDPNANGVANLSASLHQALETKKFHRMDIQKYDIPRPDGGGFEKKYWSPLNTPVLDNEAQVIYLIHQVEDVTDKIELNEALDNQTQMLQKANDELEQFVRITSHDLQEPLRKIRTFSDLVKTKYTDRLDEAGQEQLGKIVESAEKMSGRLKALLRYAYLKKEEAFVPVNLRSVINDVLTELELLIQERNAIIQVGSLPTVPGYAQQLHQLFYNLVYNAIKFAAEERTPEITITAKRRPQAQLQKPVSDRYVEITVADNGIGFDQQQAERIFTVFERLNAGKYEGTGIGLSLCKKVVINHGGEIAAFSRPGVGSDFHILLPLH